MLPAVATGLVAPVPARNNQMEETASPTSNQIADPATRLMTCRLPKDFEVMTSCEGTSRIGSEHSKPLSAYSSDLH